MSPRPATVVAVPVASTLSEFKGSGNDTTESFAAAASWEIRWQMAGAGSFEVEILNANGE